MIFHLFLSCNFRLVDTSQNAPNHTHLTEREMVRGFPVFKRGLAIITFQKDLTESGVKSVLHAIFVITFTFWTFWVLLNCLIYTIRAKTSSATLTTFCLPNNLLAHTTNEIFIDRLVNTHFLRQRDFYLIEWDSLHMV